MNIAHESEKRKFFLCETHVSIEERKSVMKFGGHMLALESRIEEGVVMAWRGHVMAMTWSKREWDGHVERGWSC